MSYDKEDDRGVQELKFQKELTALYLRWSLESDLDPMAMAEASTEVINNMCDDSVMEFEPDPELNDKMNDSEE